MSDKLEIGQKEGTGSLRHKHLEEELVEGYTAMAREDLGVAEANFEVAMPILKKNDPVQKR